MDPPAIMSDAGYNLTEIWQYPVSESGIRRSQFGPGLGQFGDPNREVSGNDPVMVMGRDLKRQEVEMRIMILKLKQNPVQASLWNKKLKRQSRLNKITSMCEQEGVKLLIVTV
ncbi:putative DNA binding protein [Corchorus olitorius]|uniref:DNA binding protein n=1 Tax=Corchorus olitorius TaxID=93759 RepID=A0A1R3GA92_9ROSI|nr:putative DNA binding protein [Corchorus olitorius]